MKSFGKGMNWKIMLILQASVCLYTTSGIMAKLASTCDFLSLRFILLYGAEIVVLGIYAIAWQQILKRVDVSVAYANRSVALLWSMLWAWLFFGETITIKNILGVLVVIAGTVLVNSDEHK